MSCTKLNLCPSVVRQMSMPLLNCLRGIVNCCLCFESYNHVVNVQAWLDPHLYLSQTVQSLKNDDSSLIILTIINHGLLQHLPHLDKTNYLIFFFWEGWGKAFWTVKQNTAQQTSEVGGDSGRGQGIWPHPPLMWSIHAFTVGYATLLPCTRCGVHA